VNKIVIRLGPTSVIREDYVPRCEARGAEAVIQSFSFMTAYKKIAASGPKKNSANAHNISQKEMVFRCFSFNLKISPVSPPPPPVEKAPHAILGWLDSSFTSSAK